jgi:hypothetical protein
MTCLGRGGRALMQRLDRPAYEQEEALT